MCKPLLRRGPLLSFWVVTPPCCEGVLHRQPCASCGHIFFPDQPHISQAPDLFLLPCLLPPFLPLPFLFLLLPLSQCTKEWLLWLRRKGAGSVLGCKKGPQSLPNLDYVVTNDCWSLTTLAAVGNSHLCKTQACPQEVPGSLGGQHSGTSKRAEWWLLLTCIPIIHKLASYSAPFLLSLTHLPLGSVDFNPSYRTSSAVGIGI